jgi:hypothetical protein
MDGKSRGAVSISKSGDYVVVDVTSLVQDWVDGDVPNNGVYLVAKSGDVTLNSADNKQYKPVLTVERRKPGGGPAATPAPTPVSTPAPAPTPVPTASPTQPPSPVPTPMPTPAPGAVFPTVELACAAYTLANRTMATSSDFNNANKVKDNCKIVLTGWSATPEQNWCPYLRDSSGVEYCGPYDNWGYMNSTNDKSAWIVAADIYNDYILKTKPQWVLKDTSKNTVYNVWVPHEHLMDHGNMDFVDFYFDFFIQVPSSVAGGRWKGTYAQRGWNMRFLDNFIVYAPEGWSSMPVNPSTGKTFTRTEREDDLLSAAARLRYRADTEAGGVRYFANVWSDVESGYFDREIYPELMQYIDYALFEAWTTDLQGVPVSEEIWLQRVTAAQDMVENRRAEPVVQAEWGDFWYALSSLLLVSDKDKGMIWSNKMYSDALIQQLSAIDLGEPLDIFSFVDNAYQRDWEKGKVIVNPSDDATVEITLDQSYQDAVTGETVTAVTLPPKSGKILLIP